MIESLMMATQVEVKADQRAEASRARRRASRVVLPKRSSAHPGYRGVGEPTVSP